MAKRSETYTINRTGTFVLHNSSTNQCRAEEHQTYSYTVKLSAKNKLNESGFIIDHNRIDVAVQEATRNANSCELLCKSICDELERVCELGGVIVTNIHVKVVGEPNSVSHTELDLKIT